MKSLHFTLSSIALIGLLSACTAATEKEPASSAPATSSTSTSAAPVAMAALPLQKTVWAWQYTRQSGARLTPAKPARYTLTFREENRVSVVADCNRGGSVYRAEGDRLAFEPIAMTKMLCAADSFDRDFLDGLRVVERYRLDDKTLTLQLQQGGEMVFAPIGP